MTKPYAIAQRFASEGMHSDRLAHKCDPLSFWLRRELVELGLPVACIDARLAQKAIPARIKATAAQRRPLTLAIQESSQQ